MSLAIIGFKNVGKSWIGKRAAERAGCTFVDTDRLIEQHFYKTTGSLLSCREIYHTYGEKLFRMLELKAICSIRFDEPKIIALGGGALSNPDCYAALKKHVRFVYLHLNKASTQARMFKNGVPLFIDANDPHTSFRRIWAKREPVFASIADLTIDLEKWDAEAAVRYIASQVDRKPVHALQ
jgi:shikimate kinase